MNTNNNIISPLTDLLTNFDFIEEMFKHLDMDTQVTLVEAVLHSAHPKALSDAIENRYESWTEGDQEVFKLVIAKANDIFNQDDLATFGEYNGEN